MAILLRWGPDEDEPLFDREGNELLTMRTVGGRPVDEVEGRLEAQKT